MPASDPLVHSRETWNRIRALHEPIGTIGEVLEKAATFVKDGAETAGTVASFFAWLEPTAAGVTILSKLTKAVGEQLATIKDPYEQGALACTLAWQAAANRAIAESGISQIFTYRAMQKLGDRIVRRLRSLPRPEEASLTTFSLESATVHPFVQRADEMLRTFLRSVHADGQAAPITTAQEISIFDNLHDGFKRELRQLLYDKETQERFAQFAKLLETNSATEQRARQALHIHAEYQARLYANTPLFSQEVFALGDVYLNTQCGALTWGQVSRTHALSARGRRHLDESGAEFGLDPFLEQNGGRHDLLTKVLELLTAAPLDQPIVIQGFAGQGKSSFTLRLCHELLKPEQGFVPLRIRLKTLSLTGDLWEGLARALELDDPDALQQPRYQHLADCKLNKALLDDQHALHPKMSRYVLMLDGWDELQIGGDSGFRKRVEDVMRRVRETFLGGGWACPVRVIVTGRPNPEIEASPLLQGTTPLLTLRCLQPDQLTEFVQKLDHAQTAARLTPPPRPEAANTNWRIPRPTVFKQVFQRYQKDFNQMQRDETGKLQDQFEVLGSPLLTFLLMRLMAEAAAHCQNEAEQQSVVDELIQQPTLLYRALTDLTVERAGKAPEGDASQDDHVQMVEDKIRDHADELRLKLRLTATAMSVLGQEALTRKEWEARLPKQLTKGNEADDPFVRLMISFYFKGGHAEQGIEFAHKSFREYLFAEHIVETIKETVSKPGFRLPLPHPLEDGPHRWQDFDKNDVRFALSRDLAYLLAPQWLSREVRGHLETLLEAEIARANPNVAPETNAQQPWANQFGRPTPALRWEQWQAARDLLADLWAWWLHSIHLRPQIRLNSDGHPEGLDKPFVLELLEKEMRLKSEPLDTTTRQPSVTAADAHLGDGLFLLTAQLHWLIAAAEGFAGEWPATEPGPRLCQTSIVHGERQPWIVFEPSGEPRTDEEANQPWYFSPKPRRNIPAILARINAELNRPHSGFPNWVLIKSVDLRQARLDGASLDGAILDGAILDGAILDGAILDNARLDNARLVGARLDRARLDDASLDRARLDDASLDRARLDNACLVGARLGHNKLYGATSLIQATGLTEEQLLSVAWLDERVILPEGFEEVRARILARQREWKATQPQDETSSAAEVTAEAATRLADEADDAPEAER